MAPYVKKIRWSTGRHDEIVAALKSGMTFADAAAMFGCTKSAINSYANKFPELRGYGVVKQPAPKKNARVTKDKDHLKFKYKVIESVPVTCGLDEAIEEFRKKNGIRKFGRADSGDKVMMGDFLISLGYKCKILSSNYYIVTTKNGTRYRMGKREFTQFVDRVRAKHGLPPVGAEYKKTKRTVR